MKLPAYPRYKPSGVEWLGDVPEHWDVKRAAAIGRFSSSGIDKKWVDGETAIQMFNYLDVYRSKTKNLSYSEDLMWTTADLVKIREHSLHRGDILITPSSETEDDIGHAAHVGELPSVIVYSYHLVRFRIFADCDSRFLVYSINSPVVRSYFESVCSGTTRMVLVRDDMRNVHIALPPIAEQRAIVAFLDQETGRVDRLVAKKQELIERLKEKRTALISRTVTQGLPPKAANKAGLPANPPLKPSGLDWLGDIPEHWEVMCFRRLILRLEQGWSPNANNYPAAPGELGVLKLGAASKGRFYPGDNKALDDIAEGVVPITPTSGDLLISRANTPSLVGDVCVVKGNHPNLIIPDLLYRLRLCANMSEDYACWFLLSRPGRAQIECDARGSSGSMVKLGQGHVRSWALPFPPLPEQAAIAAYLDAETTKLDALVAKVEAAVERLQEYRTALITAAVTGKIDVRD